MMNAFRAAAGKKSPLSVFIQWNQGGFFIGFVR